MAWKPKSPRFQQVQRLQAAHACAVDARVAADAARGVTTPRVARQRVAAGCACPRCRPPACPALEIVPADRAIAAELARRTEKFGRCWFCGEDFGDLADRPEHMLLPRARGGAHVPSNVVRACYRCGRDKGGSTVEEYRAALAQARGAAVVFDGERRDFCPRGPHDGAVADGLQGASSAPAACEALVPRAAVGEGPIGLTDDPCSAFTSRGATIETHFSPAALVNRRVRAAEIRAVACDAPRSLPPPPHPPRRRLRAGRLVHAPQISVRAR